ncbi:unnamed protein product, partial [Polarella glacialis]
MVSDVAYKSFNYLQLLRRTRKIPADALVSPRCMRKQRSGTAALASAAAMLFLGFLRAPPCREQLL